MTKKSLSGSNHLVRSFQFLVSLGLLLVLVIFLNVIFASGSQQTQQAASSTPPPPLPTSTLILETPAVVTIAPEQSGEWGSFKVPELSYSMQYPLNLTKGRG